MYQLSGPTSISSMGKFKAMGRLEQTMQKIKEEIYFLVSDYSRIKKSINQSKPYVPNVHEFDWSSFEVWFRGFRNS